MKTIQKQLAGHQDLLIGSGTVSQIRGESSQQIRRIELAFIFRTLDEIRDLDTTLYTRAQLHQQGANIEYWYDATSNASDDSDLVLLPTSAPALGRWRKVVASSGSTGLSLAGGTMTGNINFENDGTNTQMQLVMDQGSGDEAGLTIKDYAAANDVLRNYESGGIGYQRLYQSGMFNFHNVQSATGAYRFMALANNGVNAKMVLGTPWDDGTQTTPSGKAGYNHFQLVFVRDAKTTTSFIDMGSAAVRQFWVGGEGEALLTKGLEFANVSTGTPFSYTAYVEENAGTNGALVLKPNRSLVSGSPNWFTGELHIETSSTTDPVSNPNDYHRFSFLQDGQFQARGLTTESDGSLGLFGATPAQQFIGTGEVVGFTAGSGTAVLDDSVFTGNIGSAQYTIGDIVAMLKTYGLIPE